MLTSGKDRGLHLRAEGRLVLLVTVPILVGLLMWLVAFQAERRSESVEHTLRVQISIERLLLHNRAAGANQRGFLAAGEPHFVDSYNAEKRDLLDELAELSRLTSDNPRQVQNLARLKPLIDRRLQQLDSGVGLRRQGASATDLSRSISEQQNFVGSVQSAAAEMFHEEEQLLRTREADRRKAEFQFELSLFLGYGLVILIVWSLYRSVKRYSSATAEAQARLSELNAELDERVRRRTAELHAREELLNIFVRHVPAGVAMLDREMRYLQVSDLWCADYGVERDRLIGNSHYDLFPDLPERWRENHRRCLGGESIRCEEDRWDRADGTTVWLRWEIRPWGSQNGLPEGLLVFGEDITERKRIEEALRESEATNRTLLETASQAILAVDTAGIIATANREAGEMFGYTAAEMLGQSIEMLIPAGLRERHRAHRAGFNADPKPRAMGTRNNLVGLRKDGSEFPIEVRLSSVETKKGLLAVSFVSDITERKRAEKELKDSERRLRALAGSLLTAQEEERRKLARELHDDVTQQLAFLSMELGRLVSVLPPSSEARERAILLQTQTSRASSEVRRMSHGLHPSVITDFGLGIALEDFCDEFQKAHNVRVEFEGLVEDSRLNDAGATCLYRIAQEGLRNAVLHGQAKNIHVTLTVGDGLLELQVHDDGVGFSVDQMREKAGLGIVSMTERIRLVHGAIEVASQPGHGTTITASVPLEGVPNETAADSVGR